MTFLEFDASLLKRNPKVRYELHAGKLIEIGLSTRVHAVIGAYISMAVGLHNNHSNLDGDVVGASSGFRLGVEESCSPDVAYISKSRVEILGKNINFYPFSPDLSVEIRSPYLHKREVDQLVALYFRAETQLVWVIDTLAKTLLVCRRDGTRTLLDGNAELSGEDVLPGFKVSLMRMFRVLKS